MMLDYFIAANREEIIARCREKAATRSCVAADVKTGDDHGVPVFLDQLMHALRLGVRSNPEISRTAIHHGHDLRMKGVTVSQVVHAYGEVCQSITELAMEMNAAISAADFSILNRCLHDAIAGAVSEYGRERDQSTVDMAGARGAERLGFFAHELRNLLNTAIVSFEVLRRENAGAIGSTGEVLARSLDGLSSLLGRSLAETRLAEGIQNPEQISVAEFIQQIEAGSRLEANAAAIRLAVLPVDAGLVIEADRQVLAAVVRNLLQNAFKFTHPHTAVTLRVRASEQRVLIEVEDECGGLPDDNVDTLFRPFEQRSADRSGLGLGLAFSRRAIEANHGRIYARNLPQRGCIFTVDLPRLPDAAVAIV
jgi:signal transduction histidine kinase